MLHNLIWGLGAVFGGLSPQKPPLGDGTESSPIRVESLTWICSRTRSAPFIAVLEGRKILTGWNIAQRYHIFPIPYYNISLPPTTTNTIENKIPIYVIGCRPPVPSKFETLGWTCMVIIHRNAYSTNHDNLFNSLMQWVTLKYYIHKQAVGTTVLHTTTCSNALAK